MIEPAHVTLQVLDSTLSVRRVIADQLGAFAVTEAPAQGHVMASSLPAALAELTSFAAAHSHLLCMHAGVVSGRAGLVVVPGHSGLGKTTLVAALVRAGFGYVSDEMLAIDRSTGRAVAFPRAFGLAGDVWPVLGLPGDPPAPGEERYLPPDRFGRVDTAGGAVTDIVLVERMAGRAAVVPASRGPAVAELLTRSFNNYRDPAGSFRAVVALVRGSRVWRAQYAEAPDLAAVLADTIPHADSPQADSSTTAR